MDAHRFHNMLRTLKNIEVDELRSAGVVDENWGKPEAAYRDQITAFMVDPFLEALRMPDANFDRLYALIEVRQPKRQEAQWQPIDSAPKDGTEVLGWTPAGLDIVWFSPLEQDSSQEPGHNPGWWGHRGETAPGRTPEHGFGGSPDWHWAPQNQPTFWMDQPNAPETSHAHD